MDAFDAVEAEKSAKRAVETAHPSPVAGPVVAPESAVAPASAGQPAGGSLAAARRPLADLLDEVADAVGKPGLAAELGWGQSVVKAAGGKADVAVSPGAEVVGKTVVLVVGTVLHRLGGVEGVKARVHALAERGRAARGGAGG